MPTLSAVLRFRRQMFDTSLALVEQKGADYNRDQQQSGNTLFNLAVCEILGIVPSIEAGILVRLSDKLMRLISLTKPGREAAVRDESVLDTIRDCHNYLDYLGLVWLERRGATLERIEGPECESAPEQLSLPFAAPLPPPRSGDPQTLRQRGGPSTSASPPAS